MVHLFQNEPIHSLMPSRTTDRVDVTKITQAMIRLHRSLGFAQTENALKKYFYFCRVALAAATASSYVRVDGKQDMETRRGYHPCRSFTFDKVHTNSSAACPNALRTYMHSTRGHVLDAQRKRIVRSNPLRARSQSWLRQKKLARESARGITE